MNKAFKISTGEIIVYLNADDFFENKVFNKVIDVFNSSANKIVLGNLYIENQNKKKLHSFTTEFNEIIANLGVDIKKLSLNHLSKINN